MSLFSFDLKRQHVAVWKCPLCPFACQKYGGVRSHLEHKHHLASPEACQVRKSAVQEERDLPAKRRYVCSLARYKNHEPDKNHFI